MDFYDEITIEDEGPSKVLILKYLAQMKEVLKYCLGLDYEQDPDYTFVINTLQDVIDETIEDPKRIIYGYQALIFP